MYKYAGKCDDQNKYKPILEPATVSTPEYITDSSQIYVNKSGHTNYPRTKNYLNQFSELFKLKKNVCILSTDKT